jgi:hypothetical protein
LGSAREDARPDRHRSLLRRFAGRCSRENGIFQSLSKLSTTPRVLLLAIPQSCSGRTRAGASARCHSVLSWARSACSLSPLRTRLRSLAFSLAWSSAFIRPASAFPALARQSGGQSGSATEAFPDSIAGHPVRRKGFTRLEEASSQSELDYLSPPPRCRLLALVAAGISFPGQNTRGWVPPPNQVLLNRGIVMPTP